MGVWLDSRFWEAQGLRRGRRRCYAGDAPPEGRPGVPGIWVAHGRGLVDLRKQLGLDADRRPSGPEGPEVWVLWGPSGTPEVPLRSEALAQGVLEVS